MKKLTKFPFSIILAAIIWVVCLIPIPETPLDGISMIDKWTHFVMYGTLTLCIWIEAYRAKIKRKLWIIAIPVTMGGLVELAQAHLTTCRSGDWMDFLANSIGCAIGVVLALSVSALSKR